MNSSKYTVSNLVSFHYNILFIILLSFVEEWRTNKNKINIIWVKPPTPTTVPHLYNIQTHEWCTYHHTKTRQDATFTHWNAKTALFQYALRTQEKTHLTSTEMFNGLSIISRNIYFSVNIYIISSVPWKRALRNKF